MTAPASSNQLKKEHLRSAKVKQESIPLTGSRRENREHHNNTLSAEKTYIKSGKKARKRFREHEIPLWQSSRLSGLILPDPVHKDALMN